MIERISFMAYEKFGRAGWEELAAKKNAFKKGKTGNKCDKSPQLIQEKMEIYRDNMTRAYIESWISKNKRGRYLSRSKAGYLSHRYFL